MAKLRVEIGPVAADVTANDGVTAQMVEEYLRARHSNDIHKPLCWRNDIYIASRIQANRRL